jgi:hypothetical protein
VQYVLLIYDNETRWENMPKDELAAAYAAYDAFGEQHGERITGGKELQPTTKAATVRVRGGKRLTTDGPFAETKEQLGGFFIITADSLDEAAAIAADLPGAKSGCIEVRPVVEANTAQ